MTCLAHRDELFHLADLVIASSILAHSSTDVLEARWLEPGPSLDTDAEDVAVIVDTTIRPDHAGHVSDVAPTQTD